MFSFRSILLAAAAFATVASAVPTPGLTDGGVGGITGLVNPATVMGAVTGGGLAGGLTGGGSPVGGLTGGGSPVGGLTGAAVKRGEHHSPSEVFHKCHDGLADIVIQLTAAVKCEGGAEHVDHEHVIYLLGLIVEILKVALEELKLIVKVELVLDCTLKELAEIVAGVLILLIEVIFLVLSIVGDVDKILCGVIVTIGALLCEILKLVLFLVEGLLIEVAALLVPYGEHCKHIEFLDILALLHI